MNVWFLSEVDYFIEPQYEGMFFSEVDYFEEPLYEWKVFF